MMVLVCKHTRLEEAVYSVLPRQLDAQLTLLNLSGAFFDGAAVNLAKWHFESPPLFYSHPPLPLPTHHIPHFFGL